MDEIFFGFKLEQASLVNGARTAEICIFSRGLRRANGENWLIQRRERRNYGHFYGAFTVRYGP